MALKVTYTEITSDITTCRAVWTPQCWRVFDHPDLTDSAELTRDLAISAVMLAQAYEEDLGPGDRHWIAELRRDLDLDD